MPFVRQGKEKSVISIFVGRGPMVEIVVVEVVPVINREQTQVQWNLSNQDPQNEDTSINGTSFAVPNTMFATF